MHRAAKWPHSFMARSPTLGATCFGHLDLGRRFLDPSPSSWGITWGIILPWGSTHRWCFGAENWVQGWQQVWGSSWRQIWTEERCWSITRAQAGSKASPAPANTQQGATGANWSSWEPCTIIQVLGLLWFKLPRKKPF